MRNRIYYDPNNASTRIIREVGPSGRQVNISGVDRCERRCKRTKNSTKSLLIKNAKAKSPFLSAKQVAEMEDFAGVSNGYAEQEITNSQSEMEKSMYEMRSNESQDEYITRMHNILVKG